MRVQKYLAEFLGTFILATAVNISLASHFPVPTPVIAGMALGLGVYSMGGISGAHFNPAITLGALAAQKISIKDAALYIAAQLIGAGASFLAAKHFAHHAALPVSNDHFVMMSEAFGAFIFAFGVAAAAHGKISQGASGLAVGGSLLLGISFAMKSNGVLNPAVALAIGSFSLAYALAPIVGAVAAFLLYRFLVSE